MTYLPFADRLEAGQLLGREFARRKTRRAVVLGLARGGVPVASAVAKQLDFPLDAIVARKIGVPWQPELAMGAIAGTATVLNRRMIAELGVSDQEVEKAIAREQQEMRRREALYRGGRQPIGLEGHSAFLIDDGLATGSTMMAAARYVRSLKPEEIIVGVPVGSKGAVDHLRREVEDVICLAVPEFFGAVGEWYRDFRQVSDGEVQSLLNDAHARYAESVVWPLTRP